LSGIIKTRIPFSDEFIPPNIVCRDVEIIMLKKFLEPLTRNEPIISSLFVTGNVGVGKTALTKFVLLNIPAKINYAYVPVKEGNTTFHILSQIAKSFLPTVALSRRSGGDLIVQFVEAMKNKPALVIMDELDNVPLKVLRPILHTFSRETWVSFVLLSRLPSALDKLPSDTKSSLKCKNLVLGTYKKDQLHEILRQRINLALYPDKIEPEAVERIVDYASVFGSARLAINILREASEEAELGGNDKVNVNHVEGAIQNIEEDTIKTTIYDLPQTHKLALQTIAEISRVQPATFGRTLKQWQNHLSGAKLPQFTRWKFYDVVADLKKLGLVETAKLGKGRGRGFQTVLHITEQVKEVFSGGVAQ